jgi:hypothetical protein
MESFRDNDLAATLRSLRPAPRPAFAAELDERAAAGFPRRSAPAAAPLAGLFGRLRALPPRRILLPAGATALLAVVVTTAVVAMNDSNPTAGPGLAAGSAGGSGAAAGGSGKSKGVGSAEIEASSAAQGSTPQFQDVTPEAAEVVKPERYASAPAASSNNSFFGQTGHRDVERSAEMVLGAEPSEVADDAAKVFDAVHAANGVVLRSSVDGGAAGHAKAHFELLIPSAKLGDALAAFSGIAEVRSRHEGTDDITAPTVGASEHLQDSNAKIEGLLNELAGSETEAEREAIEAQLRGERRRQAFLRSELTRLKRRADLSRVSLRIETGADASASSGAKWGIGNALGDAGHVLTIAAGVSIVGLALLAPLALIALLIWLANRAWVRRGRQRALS